MPFRLKCNHLAPNMPTQRFCALLLQNRWHLVGRHSFDRLLGIKLAFFTSKLSCILLKASCLCTFGAFRCVFQPCVIVQYLPYVQNHHLKSVSTSLLETALQNFCQLKTPSSVKYLCSKNLRLKFVVFQESRSSMKASSP